MKKILGGLMLLAGLAVPAMAWDTSLNPDKVPSIGWGLDAGKVPGLEPYYGKFTRFSADTRVPLTNYFTLNFDISDTTLQNAPTGVSTQAIQYGLKMRVYLHDLK